MKPTPITLEEAQKNLGKRFTPVAGTTGYTAGRHFEIYEVLEYDFQGAGRRVPAYRFRRVDAPQAIALRPAAKFHTEYAPVTATK